MKCISKFEPYFEKYKSYIKGLLCICVAVLAYACIVAVLYLEGNSLLNRYEQARYNTSVHYGDTFAKELCVVDSDIYLNGYNPEESLTSAGLFLVDDQQVSYAKNIFQKIYPASTTKIMTAYLTLKYGNLDDVVTISKSALTFDDPEAMISGLKEGDQVTLRDLLYGLLLVSGNDCGNAIAEHISGSQEAFAELMNQEAIMLGATDTHFCNAHGLHDPEHYTTVYDLYLMFQACLQDQRFIDVISAASYSIELKTEDTKRTLNWYPTNYYSLDIIADPEGATIVGGKTGTTDEAGCCVVLYGFDSVKHPFISVTMGAEDRDILYSQTTSLIKTGMILQ